MKVIKTDIPCPACGDLICNLCLFNQMCQVCRTPFDADTMRRGQEALARIIESEEN